MTNKETAMIIDPKTGETNEIILLHDSKSLNFVKVFLPNFLRCLCHLKGKSPQILGYILSNMSYKNNYFSGTEEVIAVGSKASVRTVQNTLSQLKKEDIVKRKSAGVYMINPSFWFKGSELQRAKMLDLYYE